MTHDNEGYESKYTFSGRLHSFNPRLKAAKEWTKMYAALVKCSHSRMLKSPTKDASPKPTNSRDFLYFLSTSIYQKNLLLKQSPLLAQAPEPLPIRSPPPVVVSGAKRCVLRTPVYTVFWRCVGIYREFNTLGHGKYSHSELNMNQLIIRKHS